MASSFLVYIVYALLPFLPLAPGSLAGRDAAMQFMRAFARMWGRWRKGDRA